MDAGSGWEVDVWRGGLEIYERRMDNKEGGEPPSTYEVAQLLSIPGTMKVEDISHL